MSRDDLDLFVRIQPRFRSRRGCRLDDPRPSAERLAAAMRLVTESAAVLGYDNGLRWRDRDGACVYLDNERGDRTVPDARVMRAYRVAWARGSRDAMAARPRVTSDPVV